MTDTTTRPLARSMLLDHGGLDDIQTLVREGWIERLVVHDRAGREVMRVPILVDVTPAALAPVWIALGALAGSPLGCTVDLKLRDGQVATQWPYEPPPDVDVDRGGSAHGEAPLD